MKLVATTFVLLGLAACGQAPGPQNTASAPAPSPIGTGPVDADSPDMSNGPRNSFIICPGNPRCPPVGSQPKGRQPD